MKLTSEELDSLKEALDHLNGLEEDYGLTFESATWESESGEKVAITKTADKFKYSSYTYELTFK